MKAEKKLRVNTSKNKTLKRLYSYIYFRIFLWNKFLWKSHKMAALNSSLAISLSFYAFFMTIILTIEEVTELAIYSLKNYWYFVIAVFSIIFFNHYFFEASGRFWKIEGEFSQDKNLYWYLRGVAVWTFLLGSILMFVILL